VFKVSFFQQLRLLTLVNRKCEDYESCKTRTLLEPVKTVVSFCAVVSLNMLYSLQEIDE
jgi:hypothetical protein